MTYAGSVPMVREQAGASGSLTATSDKLTKPVFVTVIVKLAVPPCPIVCDTGEALIETAASVDVAFGVATTAGAVTVTWAVAVALGVPPDGPIPFATTVFTRSAVTS